MRDTVILSDEFSFMFPTSGRVYIWRTPMEVYNLEHLIPTVKREVLWWFGQQYRGILLVPLLPFMTELLQGRMWTGWVIRCILWSRRYFWTTVQFSKMTVPPSHTAGNVQSWFEEHEGKLQYLPWPAQSPNLNIIEPLWLVLETTARNRFPPPTSLKQLADVLQEEWYKIPLQTVQNLFKSIPRRSAAVLMSTVSVVFPLFCLTLIHHIQKDNNLHSSHHAVFKFQKPWL
jgi:hypothetical protein